MAKLSEPVPCAVEVRRVSGYNGPDYIVIDLTHERDGLCNDGS